LALIYKWHEALSLYKEPIYQTEFKNFTEVYVYLTKKGFSFPTYISPEDIHALRPAESLKSKEELAKERKMMLESKLHEMIRKKNQREASDIIKDMTGYNLDEQNDYMKPFLRELYTLKEEAETWSSFLDSAYIEEYGAYKESSLRVSDANAVKFRSAMTKIQQILSEATEESACSRDLTELENIELLETNEVLCEVLEKYQDPISYYSKKEHNLLYCQQQQESKDQFGDVFRDLLLLDGSQDSSSFALELSRSPSLIEPAPPAAPPLSLLDTDVPDLLDPQNTNKP
jgi:hypothetical protein